MAKINFSGSSTCRAQLAETLQASVHFQAPDLTELLGFDATWDEELYLNEEATASILFVSDRIELYYHESSDVHGDIYRCEVATGKLQLLELGIHHYPDCDDVRSALAKEPELGEIQYQYCE